MYAEAAIKFYNEMQQAFVKPDSSWTDKATIFRSIMEQFFKLVTKEDKWPNNLQERIDAYYDSHPEEEIMRERAHKARKKLNHTIHTYVEFTDTCFKHIVLSREDVREIYESLVLIVYNASNTLPDNSTLELLGANTSDHLKGLNDQQKDAVMTNERIVFVNAGPGTGKTTLLVQRMVHSLLKKSGTKKHIVALSFTNTAAKQLKDKFLKQALQHLKEKEYELFNGTIHAYCLRNLRKYEQIKGSFFNYMILSDEDLYEHTHDISAALNDKYTFEQVSEILKGNRNLWPDAIKETVNDIKRKNNLISLNDILTIFSNKLESDPEFAEWILQSADSLVIDEAQDLSEDNFRIFDLMLSMKPDLNIFMVGDPRQNIFEFNGGSYKHLADFLDAHKGETAVKDLPVSYRCPGKVLDFVNSFTFTDCSNTYLKSDVEGNVEIQSYKTSDEESSHIIEKIKSLDNLDSCAILSANIKGLNIFIEKLNLNGIPFVVHGGRKKLKLHIRYINNLIRIIQNNNIKSIRSVAKALKLDIYTQPSGAPRHFSEKEMFYRSPFGRKLSSIIKDHNLYERNFHELAATLIDECLPSEWYTKEEIMSDFGKLKTIATGYRSIKEYIDALSINKERFIHFYDKDYEDCISPTDGSYVTLSTIHSAKGLEWEHVFLVGMNDHNFPGIKKYDNKNPDKHEVYLNRKKKELFVACTRAARFLHISYPLNADGQQQSPSILLSALVG